MPVATVNGTTLDVRVEGSGQPLLMIHGALVADAYAPLLEHTDLAANHQVITYHRRGFGGSAAVGKPRSIAEEAADAVAVLDHLDIDRAHVVGHSLAGLIALQVVMTAPERVATLGLFEPAYLGVPAAAAFGEGVGPIVEKFQSGDAAGAMADFILAVGGPDAMSRLALLSEESNAQVANDIATLFTSDMGALGGFAIEQSDVAAITQPTLSILGTDSPPLFGEATEVLRSWLPNVTAGTIPGSSHFLQMEQPVEVGQQLLAFLANHPIAA